MDNIIQIHDVTRQEFISIIENVIEDRFTAFLKSKEPENLTVQQTAKLLNVTGLSIHNYIKKGVIPASKIGRRIVIKRVDIENSLNEVKSLKYKR